MADKTAWTHIAEAAHSWQRECAGIEIVGQRFISVRIGTDLLGPLVLDAVQKSINTAGESQ